MMHAFSERAVAPLRAWSGFQLAAVAEAFRGNLADWACAWDLDAPEDITSRVATPQDLDFAASRLLGEVAGSGTWFLHAENFQRQLHLRLFAADLKEGSVAAEIASTCMEALLTLLRARLRVMSTSSQAPTPCAATVTWTGWVTVPLPLGAALLLPPQAADLLLQDARSPERPCPRTTAPALQRVDQALASHALRVNVELEGCELSMGVLQDLQLGDVLRLRHRLDAPATARSAEGRALLRGFLVHRAGRRSLELASHVAAQEERT